MIQRAELIHAARRWLLPPVFDDDLTKTRQASLLNMIALTCLVFILVVMVGALRDKTVPASTIVIDLIAMAVIIQFLRWLRSGRVLLARLGMVIFGLIYVVGATASIGTIRTPTASIFVFWVLMTGLLFGRTGIFAGTAAASVSVGGLIIAQNAGWLHRASYDVGITQWITFTAVFAFTSGLTNHIVRGIESALALAEREIEQRRKTEASLKDSEQRYRTLVDWMPEPLVVHRGGRILFANRAALVMFSVPHNIGMVGRSILERVHADDREMAMLSAHDIEVNGTSMPSRAYKLLDMDGLEMDVEVQSTRIVYGDAFACLTSLHDITQSKALESRLEEARANAEKANLAKSRFLAAASHDLRQPAHALGMFVGRMSGLTLDAESRNLVDNMDASVRAMQDMIDGLFDISTLDLKQADVNVVAFPVEAILSTLRQGLAGAAAEKGLRLHIRPSTAWIVSSPDLLHRVLLNLANNAIRYTERGSVLVACRPTAQGTHLRIEVRDSGIGIDAQHHEDVFQEFFQVGNAQRDRNKGMGIGLSIVQRACSLLNHPIQLQSAAGKGTRFTLRVPLATERLRDAHASAERDSNFGSLTGDLNISFNGLRVLLVEDDELGRMALTAVLQGWGCDVFAAEDADAACDHVSTQAAPDIVISDYRLGGDSNGLQVLEHLNALAGRRIPACLISGDTNEQLHQAAASAGLTLLQKPVRPAKLRNLMRHLQSSAQVV